MIAILSPAKTLDFETKLQFQNFTIPDFMEDSQELISQLKKYSVDELSNLMSLSSSLSEQNVTRYQNWTSEFNLSNSRQALFCFKGGVYKGLDVDTFSNDDLLYSQKSLRIISGLHGILKPFDLIQPYRLEMGTKLVNKRGKNLYEFWNEKITESLNHCLENNSAKYLLNLASNEYFSSIKTKKINKKIIAIKFLDKKNDSYKTISFFAKKARGSMAAFVVKNKVKTLDQLKNFSGLGYSFDEMQSNLTSLVFIR
jgi:cytoplasmic iron level regulating protein YaaA (DUF328/UPF0246 family)|tara:strand:- start:307 stop:1071 length:765 start_codon:yes stop_codon:yes gene_type:complete